jgi:hypothetical protein
MTLLAAASIASCLLTYRKCLAKNRLDCKQGGFLKNAKKYEKKLKLPPKAPITPSNRTEV